MALRTTELDLSANWRWKQRDVSVASVCDELDTTHGWLAAQSMPSDIYVEHLKLGKIPDPYKAWNEHKVQWIADREWLYSCSFEHDGDPDHTDLVFEGLDTFCDVYLNGKEILKADNMFRPWRVELPPDQLESSNILLLHFKSALQIGLQLEAERGRRTAGSCNVGHESRVYVRKAQYHWCWDWCPRIMSVGPWLPIRLERFTTRIAAVQTCAFVSSSLVPTLKVHLYLAGALTNDVKVVISVSGRKGVFKTEQKTVKAASELRDVASWTFKEDEIELWWPTGHGQQPLYDVEVTLSGGDGSLLDKQSKNIGFRRVQLIQEPLEDAPGTTFLFEVNNVRIFMGGSCWVPIDNMLTNAAPERYRAWLRLLAEGNQNMVRVWGGGIYESDVFYDTCDKLGLLVWQDFMFSCGQYPADDDFLASVKPEAELAVERMRHHPSLVLLCGNNEDYQQILQWGIAELPATVIYEELLSDVISRLTEPEIPYHPGSPWGGKGWDTADPTVGDIHQWEVWYNSGTFYQNWDVLTGRFVSEFGLHALPHMQTIDYWFDGETKYRHPQSKMMAQHEKGGSYERRFAIYMNENFRMTDDLQTYQYLTRLMQSEGIGAAYRMWRRDWKGKGKQYNGGALVWQSNDSWPGTSWSIVDYFLRPKPSYFAIAREMLLVTVGIKRTVVKNKENDRPRQFYEFGAFQSRSASLEIWATNSSLSSREVILEVEYFDLESDWTERESKHVTLLPNQSTELLERPCPHRPKPAEEPEGDPPPTSTYSVVVAARLRDPESQDVLSRYADWPQPFKFLEPPEPGLQVDVEGEVVTIQVARPVKGLVLDVAGETDSVKWSDNCIDLVPGDRQSLQAKGLAGQCITAAYLGKERATPVT